MIHLGKFRSLGECIRARTFEFPSATALIEANREREITRYSYEGFREEAERFASLLRDVGLRQGDRCAVLMSNQSKWLLSAAGVFWSGGVLVPVDYKLSPSEQIGILTHAQAKFIITEWPIWMRLESEGLETLRSVVSLVSEAPPAGVGPGWLRWESKAATPFELSESERDDTACIVYSSGTAGRPKGCMLTHGNYLEQAEVLGRLFPIRSTDRYFSILPTNHAIDFMCGFILPMQFGASIVHQRTLRPEFLAWTLRTYEITHMALVPMILKALENKLRAKFAELPTWKRKSLEVLMDLNRLATKSRPRYRISRTLLGAVHKEFGGRLRTIFAGGAPVDAGTAAFFYRLGIPVAIGYGLTEAGTVLTVNDLKPFRSDTVGRPVPGLEMRLHDVNDDGVGEVWVRGPTIMKGYLDDQPLTEETIMDGWLRTGDLGTFDRHGHLRLLGRMKNMIVTEGGKNIYPEEVEKGFADLPGVEEVCVFASNYLWPSENLNRSSLVVAVRPKEANVDMVVEALRERNRSLPPYKRIEKVLLWSDEFPKTASMKVKRNELAQKIQSATLLQEKVLSL